jgi:hypothetical protein
MEIDFREVPEGERVDRALAAFAELGRKELLTLLLDEEPDALEDSLRNVLGTRADVQKLRWGVKDLPWILHLKRSLAPSAYQPED